MPDMIGHLLSVRQRPVRSKNQGQSRAPGSKPPNRGGNVVVRGSRVHRLLAPDGACAAAYTD
ncbi:hypothetical protein IFM47457_04572 [Aspergillus lentulus]|nr:hypothetical protein IFM47457_04572 [Aspergillus lentulus]